MDVADGPRTVSEVLSSLVRGWWVVAACAFALSGLGLLAAEAASPRYEAGALTEVSRAPIGDVSGATAEEAKARADEAKALAEEAKVLAEEAGPEAAEEARSASETAEAKAEEAEDRAAASAAEAASAARTENVGPGEYAQGYAQLVSSPAIVGEALAPLGVGPEEIGGALVAEASPTQPMLKVVAKAEDAEKAAEVANAAAGALAAHTEKLAEGSGAGYRATVVAQAVAPAEPYWPNKDLMVGVGGCAGLFLGALLAVVAYDARRVGPWRTPVRTGLGRAAGGTRAALGAPARTAGMISERLRSRTAGEEGGDAPRGSSSPRGIDREDRKAS